MSWTWSGSFSGQSVGGLTIDDCGCLIFDWVEASGMDRVLWVAVGAAVGFW